MRSKVPVSLWGSGGWGCVRSTLRLRPQPFATVRNRPQPSARLLYGRAYGKFSRRGHFWRFQTSRCFVSRGRRGTSWNSDVLFCNVLAVSCPYSRAEHIPCQSSWEISGNCEDPFQVKFVFHTVCQVLLFFWHVRCRLHMFFPKDDPSLLSTISGNVIINNVELSKNGLITFFLEFVIYTFQDLKTQFISFQLMFWHAWLAFHQQRHPHLSWHLCGPAKSSAQQDLGTQIIDDPVFFRAK